MFKSIFSLIFPSLAARPTRRKKRRKKGAERVSEHNFMPSGTEGASGIPKLLVADFERDSKAQATVHLTETLSRAGQWDVFRTKKVIKVGPGKTLLDRLVASAEIGRGFLEDEKADLLLWGDIENGMMNVRFLPAIPPTEGQPGSFGLGDSLCLPVGFSDGLDNVLTASGLAAVGPTFRGSRSKLAEALGSTLQNVKELVKGAPQGYDPNQYATLLICIGNAFAAHALLGGSAKRLDHAVAAYKFAMKKISSFEAPIVWAMGQSHLAAALKAKGERQKDEEALKAAAGAYRSITDTLSRIEHPLDWALAHINMGMVLYRLSNQTGRAAYLKEASQSFEEALAVYPKELMPGRWAEVTNQYGVVLMALGEQVSGNVTLEMAVKRFREALAIRKRETVPQLWAQTANNLGAACFALAKRNSEAALLREAESCFEGAKEIYVEAGSQKRVQVITSNLARVRRLLAPHGG